ncbi:MAG TPA: isochorismate synthase [Pseudonocardia sp.]|uniref:isochorismate synthase n=1 Tax=Pseudonocardia sp. TaxID=60912 RepID=UPI002CFF4A9E|nr:isochorismate synthase [Pseudonocardia sp.]HTF52459.1 isochorismate synthase [Pseudonocardia sp.]
MSIAPVAQPVRVRTRAIPDPGRPIELLPDERGPLCWVRESEGLVGWGEVARFSTRGRDRFEAADTWWRSFSDRLEVTDEVGLPGTGAVAFVSFAFAPDAAESVLVVPKVVVGSRDGVGWITEIDTGGGTGASPAVRRVSPIRPATGVRYSEGLLSVERWQRAVAEAVRRIRGGELFKAVFAHDLLATADEPLDPRFLLTGLADRYPTCWSYSVDGLVGATPELLLRRTGTQVSSRVLAGTNWLGDLAGELTDEQLGPALLASVKDREEHRYAMESLVERLRPLCAEVHAPERPSVLRLPNVTHLASDITANLDPVDPPSLLRLAGAVHPTAAVGGTPTEPALRMIAELEDMDRGRYAGPVGWVDAQGDGELGVALRCAQLSGSTARLFAGCGVVADSNPDNEVAEAAAKLVAVRSALEGRPH